jgi:hypothetical protein
MSVSILRHNRELKESVMTIRLTPSEDEAIKTLKEELQFSTFRDLIMYGMDLLNKLKEWKDEGQRFYIGKPEERKYMEVQLEIYPMPAEAGVDVIKDSSDASKSISDEKTS